MKKLLILAIVFTLAFATLASADKTRMKAKVRTTRSRRLKESAYKSSEKAVMAMPAVRKLFSARKEWVRISYITVNRTIKKELHLS